MCGIVGYVGSLDAAPLLLEGLQRLEYRGYDSSGITTWADSAFQRHRTLGKLSALKKVIEKTPLKGKIGIAHTRWATHGEPSVLNAHPHHGKHVALVHNGIIENAKVLRESLKKQGVSFSSQTDTEVIVHLLDIEVQAGQPPLQALESVKSKLEGAWALGVMFDQDFSRLYCLRQGSPLVVGVGDDAHFIGSDAIALAPWCKQFIYLDEGDFACVEQRRVSIWNASGNSVQRPLSHAAFQEEERSKGDFRHYMEKEIYIQPEVISKTLSTFVDWSKEELLPVNVSGEDLSKIVLVGCGTAYYAGLTSKYWFEKIAQLPVENDIASEFRYRQGPVDPKALYLFISQSGETADTLAAMRYVKEKGGQTACMVNVPSSSLDREVSHSFYTSAGSEIGVASTKAFTTQLVGLYCLSLRWAWDKSQLSKDDLKQKLSALKRLPQKIKVAIQQVSQSAFEMSSHLKDFKSILFIGRHHLFPIALEGALKMKELSYIHAEGYGAGELKHGPLALIDPEVPTVALLSDNFLLDKTISNLEEIHARQGPLYLVGDRLALEKSTHLAVKKLEIPACETDLSPFMHTVAIQFLAYSTALSLNKDIDQPRNLAKSVTVE